MSEQQEWLTVEEVAQRIRLSMSKVYRMLEAGEIPGARKYAATWRIPHWYVRCPTREEALREGERQ